MEPIEVTARFDQEGTITPLHFTWKEGIYRVESVGRRWTDSAGMHILAMVANGRIYRLTYQAADHRWYLERTEAERNFI